MSALMEPGDRPPATGKPAQHREEEVSAIKVAKAVFTGFCPYAEWEAIFCQQANVNIVEYEVQRAMLDKLEVEEPIGCREAAYIFNYNKIDLREANWSILNYISKMASEFVLDEMTIRHREAISRKKLKEAGC